MIKQLQEEISAMYSVEGSNFYQIYASFYLITPDSIIVFRKEEMSIIDKSNMPRVYQTMIDQCIKSGKELAQSEWIDLSRSMVAGYIEKINMLLSITTAHEIFIPCEK